MPQIPARAGGFQDAPPPPGAPPNTRGAGARPGLCGDEPIRQKMFALLPPSNTLRTVSGNPTLYISMPAIQNKALTFEILDDREDLVYETTFSLENTPTGILKIEVPEEVNLKPNTIHQWAILIRCNLDNPAVDEEIKGLMQRLEVAPPASGSPLDRANYYGENGIWQQAFEGFWELRDSHRQAWLEFLKSVKLESYADATMIN
ncbi:MAG: DUF928 domain-containing protein [Cyanobacteria bacterium SBLK]|nr:DUF928 domain-containing protein [Cyanobacteria bacterium SBLK]